MSTAVLHGVSSGCQVAADGVSLTLTVGSGSYVTENQVASPAVTSFVAASGDPNFDRYDTLYGDSAGAISAVTGVADGSMVQPDIPTGLVLARYVVRAGATAIQPGDVQGVAATVFKQHPANSLIYTFNNAALPNADPGAGVFGFNSTSLGAVTACFVNYITVSVGGSAKSWFIPGTGATTGAVLRVWSRKAPVNFVDLTVSAMANHGTGPGTYVELTVSVRRASTSSTLVPLSTDPLDSVIELLSW